MTKTLKDLFEVYRPKSPDEQKFVDKHVTIKHKDRNGNGDDVFNASKVKTIKRKEENHGYDAGDDEKVYEEVEDLDELSKDAMLKYLSANKKDDAKARETGNVDKMTKRMRGTDMAVRKYTAKPGSKYVRVPATEEVEIEEKKLTPAEMKKREEVAKAIERENPKMPMAKKMAIATATAKKVAEEAELEEGSYKDGETRMGSVGPITTDAERAERAKKYREKMMKKESTDYLETDLKKRKKNNDKAVEDMKKIGSPMKNPHFGEEVEDLDESVAKVANHLIKRYGENVRKSHVRSAANDFGVGFVALSHHVRKKLGVNRLEEEQIDEISTKLALDYSDKASDARGHRNLSTAKLDKRYKSVALAHEKIRGRHAQVPTTEAVGDFTVKIKSPADAFAQHTNQAKKNISVPKDPKTGKTLFQKMTKEEVEELDELSKKTLGSYAYKATNQVGEKGITAGLKIQNNEPAGKELKTMGKRQKGVAMAVKKLTKEEIINRAIDKYMPELEDYVPMTQEEKLVAKVEHLPEAHILMLLNLYDNLNEDNRNKMMAAIDTPEGINSLIDFAIQNRGE